MIQSGGTGAFRAQAGTTRDTGDEPGLRGTFTPRPSVLRPEGDRRTTTHRRSWLSTEDDKGSAGRRSTKPRKLDPANRVSTLAPRSSGSRWMGRPGLAAEGAGAGPGSVGWGGGAARLAGVARRGWLGWPGGWLGWRGAVGWGGLAAGWGGAARLAGVVWLGWPYTCGRPSGWRGAVDRARAAGRGRGRVPGRGHRSGWPRTWPWSVCVLGRPVGSARSAAAAVATAMATAVATATASGVVMATWWPFVEVAPEGPRRPPRADVRGRPGTRSAPVSRDPAAPGRRLPATVAVGGPSCTRPGSRATQEGGKPVPRAVPDRPPGGLATDPRARPSAVSGRSERGPSPSPVRVRRDRLGHQLPIEVGTRVDLWLSSSQRSAYAGLADRQSRPLCGVCIWVRPPLRVSYRGWCWARSFLGAVVPRGLVAYAANV
ncbi:MAG: hypothetical protein JWQ60_2282 [Pseudonocardia sp.]|nr:hypothetical protein [Pseudonocardia sp.]